MRVELPTGLPRDFEVQKPRTFEFLPPGSPATTTTTLRRTSAAAMIAASADGVARAPPPLQRRVIVPSFFRRCLICWRFIQYDHAEQIIVARRAGSPVVASGFLVRWASTTFGSMPLGISPSPLSSGWTPCVVCGASWRRTTGRRRRLRGCRR